jgi:hypothetical protein
MRVFSQIVYQEHTMMLAGIYLTIIRAPRAFLYAYRLSLSPPKKKPPVKDNAKENYQSYEDLFVARACSSPWVVKRNMELRAID